MGIVSGSSRQAGNYVLHYLLLLSHTVLIFIYPVDVRTTPLSLVVEGMECVD